MDPTNPSNQQPVQPPQPPQAPPVEPPTPSQAPQPVPVPQSPQAQGQQQIKILLVEDDLFLREIYVDILSREGFSVLTADDGEQGLQLGKDNPDAKLMLLDIMLPKVHGIDILKKLKSDSKTSSLPIVMLTNLTEEHVIQEALNAGAAGYLVKVKYTPPQVVDKVKEFIKFHHTHMA